MSNTVGTIVPTSNPTLPAIACAMARAVSAVYDACDHEPYAIPEGWTRVAEIEGWNPLVRGAQSAEVFAFVLRSTADPARGLVAIRGTASVGDGVSDVGVVVSRFTPVAGAPQPEVAAGFADVYTRKGGVLARSMQATLFDLLDAHGFRHLAITGHSLGAAIATLFAFDVAVSRPDVRLEVITFASPMVGIASWTSEYEKQPALSGTLRVANRLDVVPKYPMAPAYAHVGREFQLQFQASDKATNPVDMVAIRHSIDNHRTILDRSNLPGSSVWTGQFTDASRHVAVTSEAPDAPHAHDTPDALARASDKVNSAS